MFTEDVVDGEKLRKIPRRNEIAKSEFPLYNIDTVYIMYRVHVTHFHPGG